MPFCTENMCSLCVGYAAAFAMPSLQPAFRHWVTGQGPWAFFLLTAVALTAQGVLLWIFLRRRTSEESPQRTVCGDAAESSETMRIQRQLEESQKFLRLVIDALPMRVFWKDRECRYLGCNQAFAQDAGLESPDDVVGKGDDAMPWAGRLGEGFNRDDRAVIETGQARLNYEESVNRGDGEWVIMRTSKIPLLDLNNERVGILGVCEDITEYKRLHEILERRIVALTRYVDDPEAIQFNKLFDLAEIQRIQDEFAESTGVSSVIAAADGGFITRPSRVSPVCRLVLAHSGATGIPCFAAAGALAAGAADAPVFTRCDGSGLSVAVSPILVGGVHVASWVTGQVRVESGIPEKLCDCAAKAGLDRTAYCEAYAQIPAMTREKFTSVAQTAHTLCDQLTLFATQNISQARLLQQERERQRELRRYQAVIEQMPDGVIIIGKDRRIQFANPAFTRITGYSRAEAIGMDPAVLSNGGDGEKIQELVATVSAGGIWSGRLHNRRKDGTLYTEESVVSPIFDEEGKLLSCVATMRDVSAEVVREDELRYRQKMTAVGQLAGNIAHDFNNVLQAIFGFSEILMCKLAPGSLEFSSAQQINSSAKRAASLTRGLLALSRREQDDGVVEDVDLNHLLQESALLLHLLCPSGIEIVYDLAPDLWRVRFVCDKLYQVVVHLVINARDAMPAGGVVTIKTENAPAGSLNPAHRPAGSGDCVRLTVHDEGAGIPESLRNSIFDPFYTTSHDGRGAGLGLSIVYVLVKNYGGRVCFESDGERGTQFFVYLPVKKE